MADFTTTTNLSLKKPAIGGSSDKWGEYINANLDTIDIEIQTLKTASSSRTLESLSNVLNLTPTTGQVLQYGIASWSATTLSIPEDVEDLSNVTVTSPSDGQVLTWSTSNSRWENQTPGAATIPNGSITSAKLSTSLQGQLNLILQTTGTPTDDQILRYNATTTNWEFQDLPGGTISALSDTDVSGISNQDVLVYNSTSGDWVSRPLAIADVTGLQTALDAKLESSDLSVSSLTDTTITTTADNSVLVYDASDSKWKNEGPSTARSSLGLGTLATQNTITESQISDLGSYITASSTDTLTNKSGAISQWTNDSGYLTAETNDLGSAVTGTLQIANGGTGQTTASAARIALLPTLGTAGQVLAVNTGTTDVEWVDASSGSGTSPGIDDNASSTALTIDSSGNVGIGTSSPAYKLDVNGDALINGIRVGLGPNAFFANTVLGSGALNSNISGPYNTANGYQALYKNTSGSGNTANGYQALYNNTSGYRNTANGYRALYNNTTGSGNFGAAFVDNNGSYTPVFDPTTQSNRIVMGNTSVTNAYIQVAWTVVSDARDKTQISPMRHGLDFVNQLNPVQFKFRISRDSEETNGGKRYGFLAQEVLEVEGKDNVIVDTEDPEKLKMTNEELIPVMVKAMQEMSADIKILKAEIAMLKGN